MKRIILEVFRLMSHRNFIILSIECIKHKILNDALNGEFNPSNGELLKKYHSMYNVLSKKLIFI